jgi:MATE family multidrug resistance protein
LDSVDQAVGAERDSFRWQPELRSLLGLTGPLAAGLLAEMAMSFTDMVVVGRLGSLQLAAVGLGANLLIAATLVAMGVLSVVGVLAAQAHGSGDDPAVARIVHQSFFLASLISVPVMIAGFFPAPVLRLLGQEPAVIALAQDYLRAAVWSFLPYLYFTALRNFVAALAQARAVMVVTLAAVACNLLLNWVLVFGRLGLPALGVAGSGIATSIVCWLMAVALGLHVTYARPFRAYRVLGGAWAVEPGLLADILRLGIPPGLVQAVETVLFTGVTVLMGVLGAWVLAAHNVAAGIASIAYMIPSALAQAASMRVAHAIGQGDPLRARGVGLLAIGAGTLYMAGVAVVMWAAPAAIASIYLDAADPTNAGALALAVHLLAIAAVFQVVDGIQVIATGALRGLRDTTASLIVGLLCFWLIGLGGGYVLAFPLRGGGPGLWWAVALGLAVAALLLTWRFVRRTAALLRPHAAASR